MYRILNDINHISVENDSQFADIHANNIDLTNVTGHLDAASISIDGTSVLSNTRAMGNLTSLSLTGSTASQILSTLGTTTDFRGIVLQPTIRSTEIDTYAIWVSPKMRPSANDSWLISQYNYGIMDLSLKSCERYYGIWVGMGGVDSGSIHGCQNAYGMYVQAQMIGNVSNIALLADNLVVGSYIATTPPNGGVLISGSTAIGTSTPNSSAKLHISSTTQGFLPPTMSTTQKNAISSPAEGLCVYDNVLKKLCLYNGTAWTTLS